MAGRRMSKATAKKVNDTGRRVVNGTGKMLTGTARAVERTSRDAAVKMGGAVRSAAGAGAETASRVRDWAQDFRENDGTWSESPNGDDDVLTRLATAARMSARYAQERRGLVLEAANRGYDTKAIAKACSVPERTIRSWIRTGGNIKR